MRHARLGLLAALAAATVAACDSSDDGSAGSSVPTFGGPTPTAPDEYVEMMTSQVRLRATVESLDDLTALVTVRLSDNSIEKFLTYYRVKPNESLTACVGAVCKPLLWGPAEGSAQQYWTELPYVAETPYTISFVRPDDASAVNTFVTLPATAILAPGAGSYVTDGQTVIFHWAPATGQSGTAAVMEARCEHPNGGSSTRRTQLQLSINPDLGEAGVAISLQQPPPQPRAERCHVEFSVSTVRTGVVDSALEQRSSSISSRTRRSVIAKWTPLP